MKGAIASSGIEGLDSVLAGGWPTERLFLVHGFPGSGKTTLGFQFLLEGQRQGEKTLYITLSESTEEIHAVAEAHGWALGDIAIFELDAAEQALGLNDEQTMFDPSDIEFRATSRAIMEQIDRVKPTRVVFDSLSELSYLARDALTFRRELMILKQTLMKRGATVLLLSDGTATEADRHLQSLTHGVLQMEQLAPEYGAERRRLRVIKLRGTKFRGGYHDYAIERGGIIVYPRLVAAEHGIAFSKAPLPSGNLALDQMLGGGLARGASTMFMGPAGCGKSSIAALFAYASAEAGEPAAMFLLDERIDSLLDRADAIGAPLRAHMESGLIAIHQIDPAQLSPGEFAHRVRMAVEQDGARYITIDSLNGYLYAMPEERFLALHLHELLTYLASRGVATSLVLAQAGLVGTMTTPVDLTYVADSVVLLRFFEAAGEIRRAISIMKKRSGSHDMSIREFRFGKPMQFGEALVDFHGVLTGVPTFVGDSDSLMGQANSRDAD